MSHSEVPKSARGAATQYVSTGVAPAGLVKARAASPAAHINHAGPETGTTGLPMVLAGWMAMVAWWPVGQCLQLEAEAVFKCC